MHTNRDLIRAGVAIALTALCVIWTVRYGAALANDATDDDVLTVEQCIDDNTNASVEPLERALVEGGILDEDLLRTKVTGLMCDEMLERASEGTPAQKLITAQNYVQEIELIEDAMHRAADETAAKGADRRFAGFDSPASSATPAAETYAAAHQSLEDNAYAQVSWSLAQATTQTATSAAEDQYPDGTGASTETPASSPDEGGGDGTGVVAPETKQAAAISSAGAKDSDASTEETLNIKEAAGEAAGASPSEADAGATCSVEFHLASGASVKTYEGKIKRSPIPEEMRPGSTETVTVSISGATREDYKELLERQNEKVAKASESDVRCVRYTDLMTATLISSAPNSSTLKITPLEANSKRRILHQDAEWNWDLNARAEGRPHLILDVQQDIGRGVFQAISEPSPFFESYLTVKAPPLQSVSAFIGKHSDVLLGVLLTSIIVPAATYAWRRRKGRSEEPADEEDEYTDETWV